MKRRIKKEIAKLPFPTFYEVLERLMIRYQVNLFGHHSGTNLLVEMVLKIPKTIDWKTIIACCENQTEIIDFGYFSETGRLNLSSLGKYREDFVNIAFESFMTSKY